MKALALYIGVVVVGILWVVGSLILSALPYAIAIFFAVLMLRGCA